MVGLGRLELPTSRLSGVRSNRAELQAPMRENSTDLRSQTLDLKGQTKTMPFLTSDI